MSSYANHEKYSGWVATYPDLVVNEFRQDTDGDGYPDILEMIMDTDPYAIALGEPPSDEQINAAYRRAQRCQNLVHECAEIRMALCQKAESLRMGSALSSLSNELGAVIDFAHLADGSTHLIFSGSDSFSYTIEACDDFDDWIPVGFEVPVVDGIGEWASRTAARKNSIA